MAEIGQVLIGRGDADYAGRRMPGAQALRAAGLEPIRLKAKEGLALISANGVTMGHGSLVLADVAELLDAFDVTAALSLEAFGGTSRPSTRRRPGCVPTRDRRGPRTGCESCSREAICGVLARRATCRTRSLSGVSPRPTGPATTPTPTAGARWRSSSTQR